MPDGGGGCVCVRCGVCVAQNVPVLEILGVGTHLQVFFEGFLALDGGEGGLVDGGSGVFVCHVGRLVFGSLEVRIGIWDLWVIALCGAFM